MVWKSRRRKGGVIKWSKRQRRKVRDKNKMFNGKCGESGEKWPFLRASVPTKVWQDSFWCFLEFYLKFNYQRAPFTWRERTVKYIGGTVHFILILPPQKIHLVTASSHWCWIGEQRCCLQEKNTFFFVASCSSFSTDLALRLCSHNSGVWQRLMASNFVSLAKA